MNSAKIAVSIDGELLKKIDYFVNKKKFKTRSHAIQIAVSNTIEHLEHKRLAQECSKLNVKFEQQIADEGISEDEKEWPTF